MTLVVLAPVIDWRQLLTVVRPETLVRLRAIRSRAVDVGQPCRAMLSPGLKLLTNAFGTRRS
jgi:hypothetical protein